MSSLTNRLRKPKRKSGRAGNSSKRIATANNSHFTNLGNKAVTADWSLISGRIPHMNGLKMDNIPYKFCDTLTIENSFTTNTSVPTFKSYLWSLSDVANAGNYVALFDQYRLTQIEFWTFPTVSSGAINGLYKSVVDYDNASNLSSLAAADEYQNVHVTTLGSGHYRRITPHAAMAVYAGAFTSFANVTSPWIDCSNQGVQHYGVKLAVDVTTGGAFAFDVITKYYFEFRNRI
jgi:hypothetical protein